MPRMGEFALFGKRFFRRGRKLEDAPGVRRYRQAMSNFLTLADWNAPELLQQTAIDQLQ